MKLVYSEYVAEDIEEIYEYISADDENAASETIGQIEKAILGLLDFPLLGNVSRIRELRVRNIRMLPVGKYLVFYKVCAHKDEVQILRVLHGARDYRTLFV